MVTLTNTYQISGVPIHRPVTNASTIANYACLHTQTPIARSTIMYLLRFFSYDKIFLLFNNCWLDCYLFLLLLPVSVSVSMPLQQCAPLLMQLCTEQHSIQVDT